MKHNMSLGLRLGLGFAALVAIALLLGGMAVWEMRTTTRGATAMATQTVPEVAVANEVERAALLTMYEIRGYALSEQTNFLNGGLKNLAEVKTHLEAARRLAATSTALARLKAAADKAQARVVEYEQLVQQTVAKTEAMAVNRAQMDTSVNEFMEISSQFLANMNKAFADETSTNAPMAKLQQRNLKINAVNDVIDAGNAVRLAAWRAQAERDLTLVRDAEKHFDTIAARLNTLKPITAQAVNLKVLADCQKAADAYRQAMKELVVNWTAREEIARRRGDAAAAVLAEAKNTATQGLDDTRSSANESAVTLSSASRVMVVGLFLAVLIGIGIATYMTRSVTKPIRAVTETLAAGAEQTSAAASQVSSASQSLAEGASEQAASLEEASSSLEEMSSMTKRNTESAQKVKDLGSEARHAGDTAVIDMQAMAAAMDAIKTSSDDIAKIIKTIDEIAFQTNILALNAAVEAARAGESGAGFAVVADEVRSLAQRCAQAAKETASKIEDSVQKSARGVAISARVAKSLEEIVGKARQVDEMAGEVAAASREQSQGIEQLNLAIGQMDKVTQSNAAGAEESASASEELNAQAGTLQDAVADLTRLVDGNGESGGKRTGQAPGDNGHERPANRRPAKAGHGGTPKNTPRSADPTWGPAPRHEGTEIPTEVAFKDF